MNIYGNSSLKIWIKNKTNTITFPSLPPSSSYKNQAHFPHFGPKIPLPTSLHLINILPKLVHIRILEPIQYNPIMLI